MRCRLGAYERARETLQHLVASNGQALAHVWLFLWEGESLGRESRAVMRRR